MADEPSSSGRASDSVGFILEAAAELFVRRGFESTSLQVVADRAGVAKGLIAHHFRSKDGLLVAVLQEFYARQSTALMAAYDPSLELRERITAIVDAYFDFICASYLFPRLIQHMTGRNARVRELSQQQLRRLHAWIEQEVLADLPSEGPAAARQFLITFAGAITTYFSFAPALGPSWPGDEGLLGEQALADRRAHLHLIIDAFWSRLELPSSADPS